jgi:uncharacterized protein (UPF0332 family)
MTGSEFISLAIKLSSGSTEAELRTSVSRAYYGVFHLAKALMEDCGIAVPRGVNPHDKVYFCLDNCLDEDAREAAHKLSSLRAIRNDADYDLETDQFATQSRVQTHLRTAREIDNALSTCRQKLTALRPQLREQAIVLGLIVLANN